MKRVSFTLEELGIAGNITKKNEDLVSDRLNDFSSKRNQSQHNSLKMK